MDADIEESTETNYLMQNEDGNIEGQRATSITKTNVSSGSTSINSRIPDQTLPGTDNSNLADSTKISYVSEKRLHRDLTRSNYSNRPRNIPKDATDVKHMEKSLLELLDDFHTGKLSAFASGCSMEQMISIRDQQEHLARLHFRLCADVEKPIDDTDNEVKSTARDKMSQLVQSLEQLSTSIEHLHSEDIC